MSLQKSKIISCVRGLNGKALEEAGRRNMAANGVGGGHTEHDSNAAMMDMTKANEQVVP
jgi:hypothetical protein